MNTPYRFVNRKRRKNIYVTFEHLPGKEFSTGTSNMREGKVPGFSGGGNEGSGEKVQ